MSRFTIWRGRRSLGHRIGAAAAAATLLFAGVSSATPAPCSFLAPVAPSPGFPDGMVLRKSRLYVAGPAAGGGAGSAPSAITVFHEKTGRLLETIPIQGEDTAAPHALTGLTVDAKGRFYALSSQLGVLRIASMHHNNWQQSVYAGPFPDMPPCHSAGPSELCSPTMLALPPMPSDITFAADGTAYVTDAAQATIYRIASGGGAPEVWLRSEKLAGFFDLEGVRGIVVSPDGKSVYVTVGFSLDAPWEGRIYAIPRIPAPAETDIALVHVFPNFEAPAGFALGEDGALFVALTLTNEIAVVNPSGGEIGRFSVATSEEVPLDGPAHVAFDGKGGLFVTNQAAASGLPEHFAVLAVDVGDRGERIHPPKVP